MRHLDLYSLHFAGMTADELRVAITRYRRAIRAQRWVVWRARIRFLGVHFAIVVLAFGGALVLLVPFRDRIAWVWLPGVVILSAVVWLPRLTWAHRLGALLKRLDAEDEQARASLSALRDAVRYGRKLLPTALAPESSTVDAQRTD